MKARDKEEIRRTLAQHRNAAMAQPIHENTGSMLRAIEAEKAAARLVETVEFGYNYEYTGEGFSACLTTEAGRVCLAVEVEGVEGERIIPFDRWDHEAKRVADIAWAAATMMEAKRFGEIAKGAE